MHHAIAVGKELCLGLIWGIVPYFEPLHYTLQDMEQHPKYIQDFYQHELDRGLTANTVIHYHANIRKCLQYAFQIGMIRSNPADRVERPRKEKFKSEIYSGEELEQLFKVIQGDPSEFGVTASAAWAPLSSCTTRWARKSTVKPCG